ncbi:heme exporter protein CcmB [Microaerobacter geothermalis]|uniref:heme exporter protein CcmB n=1 Tax=Microaerobacter geothermalis TaxID=674972 RepID=UPI001F271932|nr:heme exporter protein CcmB [Microaerobacter geothermalis]MCF6095162.1 heme exporter protein CcmB [Microaerobacter geothermalis]
MKKYLNVLFTIIGKEIASEIKTKEMFSTMVIFSSLVIVIFSFAFDPMRATVKEVFPGMMWVMIVFSGILGLNRSFVSEKLNHSLMGMMLIPVDRSAIYVGKMLANFLMVSIVELISIPLLYVLFDYRWQGNLFPFLTVVVSSTFGFIAIGTFLSALSAHSRSSELLLPLILFPIVTPLIIGAVETTGILLSGENVASSYSWLRLILVFDVIFFVIPMLLFDYLLEV